LSCAAPQWRPLVAKPTPGVRSSERLGLADWDPLGHLSGEVPVAKAVDSVDGLKRPGAVEWFALENCEMVIQSINGKTRKD
jgi:hypothetical protein